MKDIKIVMVIMGTLIGAGFASGREIYLFFGKFGKLGQLGIIISAILTGIIIYKTLKLTKEKELKQYNDFLENINIKYPKVNYLIKIIVTIFLLISFYIMVAGFSAYIKQIYKIPTYISSIIFVLIAYLIFKGSLQGMMKSNMVLVPILIFLIIYLGMKNIPYLLETKEIINNENISTKGWLISSMLYTSYNSIILIPILVTMKKYLENKKQIKNISIISVILIITLSFCIYGLLLKGQYYVQELEMPLLEITKQFGKIFRYAYGVVIIFSIFTSAISTGYSFLENVSKDKKTYKRNLIFMSISSVLISNIGFSKLVEILYPLFGILGLFQIIFLCKKIKINRI